MNLSGHDDLVKFFCNTPNHPDVLSYDASATVSNFGRESVDSQPLHSFRHIRQATRLKIGRLYQICRAGYSGVVRITGKFLGETDTGELCFLFQKRHVEDFPYDYLGLAHYPEDFGGRWNNYIWVEAMSLWEVIF